MIEPRTKTGILGALFTAFVLMVFIVAAAFLIIANANAALPPCIPASMDEVIDETSPDGSIRAAVWQCPTTKFCFAGNPNNKTIVPPPWQAGDTLITYGLRALPQLINRDVTAEEAAFCNTLFAKLPSREWVVTENYYRGELRPDRPVYQLTDVFPSVKKKLTDLDGDVRATPNEPCGDFVAKYGNTADYQWRKYKAGVTACRKATN